MEHLPTLDLTDLDLDELDIKSLRDTVALPETGVSSSSGCPNCGSCTHPTIVL